MQHPNIFTEIRCRCRFLLPLSHVYHFIDIGVVATGRSRQVVTHSIPPSTVVRGVCYHVLHYTDIIMEKQEIITIHEFDLQLICEYFSAVERQGPGSPEMTVEALGFIDDLTENSRIADLGCGTGGQTRVLAHHAPGRITAIDIFPEFIRLFNEKSREEGLEERVKGIVGTMAEPPFEAEELDLIWSEGAIYNIGFERGLRQWRKFLKRGGYVAVTEGTWFTDERPAEIEDFWKANYPEIDTIPNKVAQMQRAGYIPVATFVLPETCWTDHFFAPQAAAREKLLAKYPGNATAERFVAGSRREEELYDKYKEYYGYVFYIGKKR